MTTTLDGAALTARALLLGGADASATDLELRLATQLDQLDLPTVAHTAHRALLKDFTEATAGVLDLDLTDVLVAGWRKHSELRAAAARTLAAPGTRETVKLAAHRISHTSQPSVDVLVGETKIARVTMTLAVEIIVTSVVASIYRGRLVALHSGTAKLTGSLSIEGAPPVKRSAQVELPGYLALGSGLSLT